MILMILMILLNTLRQSFDAPQLPEGEDEDEGEGEGEDEGEGEAPRSPPPRSYSPETRIHHADSDIRVAQLEPPHLHSPLLVALVDLLTTQPPPPQVLQSPFSSSSPSRSTNQIVQHLLPCIERDRPVHGQPEADDDDEADDDPHQQTTLPLSSRLPFKKKKI